MQVQEKKEEAREEEQLVEEDRQTVLRESVQAWNECVQGLLRAHQSWEKYCQLRVVENIRLEEYPLEAQKVIFKGHPFGDYSLLVEDMTTQPPVREFLKSQLVKI